LDKKKILVIDDEVDLTRLIKLNLEDTGEYSVRTENNPLHGLSCAREFQPDLIFLDVMMPDLDGGDLCRQLENDPLTRNIPVVFLTAVVKKEEITENKGLIGHHPFIAKPASSADLVACINKFT
jgi:CheY-like chemotaxis protein